jgi:Transglutaminase-like superfamily
MSSAPSAWFPSWPRIWYTEKHCLNGQPGGMEVERLRGFWKRVRGRRARAWVRGAGLGSLWLLLVCYPNPWLFCRNFLRYARFPVDPAVARHVSFPVPREPAAIEQAVLRHVRYEYDWQQYGVPWYVPTAAEVAASGRGDCESRAILLASLLAARGVPYRLRASLVHIWVEYPGKPANADENDAIALMRREGGRYHFQCPALLRWREDLAGQREALWDAMPPARRVLLLGGWAALLLWGVACAGVRLPRARGREQVVPSEG